MKKILAIIMLLCISGCIISPLEPSDHGSTTPVKSVAIVVALTQLDWNVYNGWSGKCSGSNIDLNRMVKTCRENGIERVVTLYNKQATAYAVIRQILLAAKALEPAASRGEQPLLIFYYSGHGGLVYDSYHTEKGSADQTLCLWDGQLVDNLFWDVLLKVPKGVRVIHITDTCNSGTNFKLAPPVSYNSLSDIMLGTPDKFFRAKHRYGKPENLSCDFIHFGGCDDLQYSNGNNVYGGLFTYALLKLVKPDGKTYKQWFDESKTKMLLPSQIPTICVIQSEESIKKNGKVEDRPAMK